MDELELTRTSGDRSLYALGGVGRVRLEGPFSRRATAEAAGSTWRFDRRGFWQRHMQATDAAGATVGEFTRRDIRRGGTIRWRGRELTLQPVGVLRERYILAEADRDFALIDGKGWGRRPVKLTLADPEAVDPGLLLFVAYVVHQLAVSASSSSAGASVAVMGG